MQQLPTTTEGTLRTLRLIHVALIVSMILYLYLVRMIPAEASETSSPTFVSALYVTAILSLAVGQWLRSRQLRPALETLRTKPDDAAALGRWRAGVIIGDAMAESVVLYGFVIHLLGGTGKEIAPFFVAGFAAMVFWWPKEP